MNTQKTRLFSLCLACFLMALAGCAAGQVRLDTFAGVPWPPPPGVLRQVTSDNVVLEGAQAVDFGGGAKVFGTSLKLAYKPDALTYGVWSLGGFTSSISLAQLKLSLSWIPNPPDPQTKVFIGLANYSKGYWEWHEVTPEEVTLGEWVRGFASDDNYIHNGTFSVAAVITGIGSAVVDYVEFVRVYDDNIPVPQNLHVVDTNIGSISLAWDDVADVSGYNLYRSNFPDFRNAVLVDGSPFPDSQCTDLTGIKGWMMYYKVAAARGTAESPLSNMVDIFCPEADMLLPENIQIVDVTPTAVEITWDWNGAFEPESWVVYWKKYQDFHLFSEGEDFSDFVVGWAHHYTFEDFEPDSVYFFRLAARDADANTGRMTDDAPLTTEALWQWGPVENTEISAQEPMRAIIADGDLTATYFSVNDVRLARRNQGTWTENITSMTGNYTTAQAVGYTSGEYAIAARSTFSDDVFTTVGTPDGGWSTPVRIHGDGGTGIGHPWSGVNMRMATSDNEFSLIHWASDSAQVILHTRPVGDGPWTTQALRNVNDTEPSISLCYYGTNLGVIVKNNLENPVYFGDSNSSFAFTEMSPNDGTSWGMFNALNVMLDRWVAVIQSFSEMEPYIFDYDGANWNYTPLEVSPEKNDGHFELEIDGEAAYLLLWSSPSTWHFYVLEEGIWIEKIFAYPGMLGSDPQLVVLNHEVFIVYVDQVSDVLMAVKGTPPA